MLGLRRTLAHQHIYILLQLEEPVPVPKKLQK